MSEHTNTLAKALNARLRAQERGLAKLIESVIRKRGDATSLRCGLCRTSRSSDDVYHRKFSHAVGCPAAALENVRELLEDPEADAEIRSLWASRSAANQIQPKNPALD